MSHHSNLIQRASVSNLALFALIISVLSIGCNLFSGKSTLNKEELSSYTMEFIQEGQKRLSNFDQNIGDFDIQFGELPEGKAGSCKKLKRLVTINPDLWTLMDSIQRKALVFHELAHCVLDRDHVDSALPRGECVSLMVGHASDSTCYYDFYSNDWKGYYLDELFGVRAGVPKWYYGDQVLSDNDLEDLVMDKTIINNFNSRIPKDLIKQDYQIAIDSFNQDSLVTYISLRWATYSVDIDIEEGIMEVQSLHGHNKRLKTRHIVPRLFSTDQIPTFIKSLTLRKKNGFYDIFLNDNLAYRSSAHYLEKDQNDMFGIMMLSDELRVINGSVKIYGLNAGQ